MIREAASVLLVLTACSCKGAPQDDTQAAAPDARSLLVAAVRDSAQRSEYGSAFDSSRVQFSDTPSTTVPDLLYHWAWYTPADLSAHAAFTAVAVSRVGRAQLFTGPESWLAVVDKWFPQNTAAASSVCTEIIAFTRPEADPERMPIIYRDSADLARPFVFVHTAAARAALTPPRVSEPGSGQIAAEFWVIEIGRARRYSCLVEHDGASLTSVGLTLLSEEPDVGLLDLGS